MEKLGLKVFGRGGGVLPVVQGDVRRTEGRASVRGNLSSERVPPISPIYSSLRVPHIRLRGVLSLLNTGGKAVRILVLFSENHARVSTVRSRPFIASSLPITQILPKLRSFSAASFSCPGVTLSIRFFSAARSS